MLVNPGDMVALTGASGSGKTTLIHTIMGFLRPRSGNILIDKKDMNQIDMKQVNLFSFVSQESTIIDNILINNFPIDKNIDQKQRNVQVFNALKQLKLLDIIDNKIENLNIDIGDNACKLSGGQKQRLAIARALYLNRPFLVFDEATAALDPDNELIVLHAIRSFVQNDKACIIIAHRDTTIRFCNKVYACDNQKLHIVKDENSGKD